MFTCTMYNTQTYVSLTVDITIQGTFYVSSMFANFFHSNLLMLQLSNTKIYVKLDMITRNASFLRHVEFLLKFFFKA